jgi:cleavage stimulation factor subunit 3
MQEVRRAYQRAVSVPTNSIDALYREYDAFEHGVSPTLAKALLAEVKPRVDHIRVGLALFTTLFCASAVRKFRY